VRLVSPYSVILAGNPTVRSSKMKDKLVWIGVIVVALGLVLPWATFRATLGGNPAGGGTLPGYQYIQSFVALAISLVGVLVGIKLSAQVRSMILIASGVIVIGVTGTALSNLSAPAREIRVSPTQLQLPPGAPRELRDAQRRSRPRDMTARVSSDVHIGIFVTMIGGALIAAAGVVGMRSEQE